MSAGAESSTVAGKNGPFGQPTRIASSSARSESLTVVGELVEVGAAVFAAAVLDLGADTTSGISVALVEDSVAAVEPHDTPTTASTTSTEMRSMTKTVASTDPQRAQPNPKHCPMNHSA